MADSILTLYRSATDVGAQWGPGLDQIEGPGVLIDAGLDPFRSQNSVEKLAARTNGQQVTLPDQGHWWMLGDPAGAAAVLTTFWASLPD
jgi:hypothetical protein